LLKIFGKKISSNCNHNDWMMVRLNKTQYSGAIKMDSSSIH